MSRSSTYRGESFEFKVGQPRELDADGPLRAHDDHGDVCAQQPAQRRLMPAAAPDRLTHGERLVRTTSHVINHHYLVLSSTRNLDVNLRIAHLSLHPSGMSTYSLDPSTLFMSSNHLLRWRPEDLVFIMLSHVLTYVGKIKKVYSRL